MKILVLTSRFPYPPIGGEKLRIFNIIKFLSERCEVDVFSLYGNDGELQGIAEMEKYCNRVFMYKIGAGRRIWNTFKGWLLRGWPLQVAYYFDASAKRRVDEILISGYTHILVHLVRMLEYVDSVPREKIFLELTDAISMNYLRIKRPRNIREQIYVFERERLLKYEVMSCSRVGLGVVVSREDANFLCDNGFDNEKIRVIKNGTSMPCSSANKPYDPNLIVFLGNMRSSQNENMCLYFIEEVFPLVLMQEHKARFMIIGANPSKNISSFQKNENIIVTGPVGDVAEFMMNACLSICPMQYGAGIQNKILESMALGVPVVASTIGLEGIDARDGEEILVANDPKIYADRIIALMRSPELRQKISKNSKDFIVKNYRWEVRLEEYLKLLVSV